MAGVSTLQKGVDTAASDRHGGAGSYVVVRIRDTFGANAYASGGDANGDDTKPFNPKHITYELTAQSGGGVSVNYLDENGQPIWSTMPRCRGRTRS